MREITEHRITTDKFNYDNGEHTFESAFEWVLWDGYHQTTCEEFLGNAGDEINEQVKVFALADGHTYRIDMVDEFGKLHQTQIDFGKVTLESLLVVLLDQMRAVNKTIPKGPFDLWSVIEESRRALNEFHYIQFERIIQKIRPSKTVPV